MMIEVTPVLAIDERELSESFVRASGPGGQHVNTTSSAVELRFDAAASPHLAPWIKERLRVLAGQRMTQNGVLVIFSDVHRSQKRNREDARERLIALLREASRRPAIRRPTRPTLASKKRRLELKGRRGSIKQGRRGAEDPE